MAEATIETGGAADAAANLEALRALESARTKEIAQLHFAMVMGALTLWGAADAWVAVSDLMIARVVVVANALIAALVVTSVLHEWGHFAGARLSGAVSPVLEKPVKYFFMFDFKFDENDSRQFVWMSWGGILTPWLVVVLVLLLVPLDTVGRVVLLAAFVARAAQVSLFEVPVTLRALRGGDPRAELGKELKAGFGRSRSLGNMIGVAVGALVLLGFQ